MIKGAWKNSVKIKTMRSDVDALKLRIEGLENLVFEAFELIDKDSTEIHDCIDKLIGAFKDMCKTTACINAALGANPDKIDRKSLN